MAAWPLVARYRIMRLQALDPSSRGYAGGFGKWVHLGAAAPENRDAATSGVDTPCSYAWVDLGLEPWLLELPANETGRYVSVQCNDLWGFVVDVPGTIKDGDEGGQYLLVPPDWNGTLPEGVRRAIKGESRFLGLLARIEQLSPDDAGNVRKYQRGLTLQPLSAFLHTPPPRPGSAPPWPAWIEGSENRAAYFGYVNFLLAFTRPHALDRPLLDRMARIGVGAALPWPPPRMKIDTRLAIEAGMNDARRLLQDGAARLRDPGRCFGSREMLGAQYALRATGAEKAPYGAPVTQIMEVTYTRDALGAPLSGAGRRYRFTFPASLAPPCQYFWSLSICDVPGGRLVPNAIKRFSIGSRGTALVAGADGAVTLDVQHDRPRAERIPDWLPAPAGPFRAVLRLYGPQAAALTGTWPAPVMKRDR